MALGPIFLPNLPPKIHQHPLKIDAKRHSNLDFNFWSIFDRIWLPTSTPRTSKNNDFSFVFPHFLQNRPFEVETDFGSDLGANLPPLSLPKSIKIRFLMASKNYAIWASIFMPFCVQLGPILSLNLEPSWLPGAPQIASQDAFGSQNPPRPPKWVQNDAPAPQNEARDPPFWIAFDVNFGYMLMICSLLFFIFGIDFGVDYTG